MRTPTVECPGGHRMKKSLAGWVHKDKLEAELCVVESNLEEAEISGGAWPPDFDFFDRGLERRLPLELRTDVPKGALG